MHDALQTFDALEQINVKFLGGLVQQDFYDFAVVLLLQGVRKLWGELADCALSRLFYVLFVLQLDFALLFDDAVDLIDTYFDAEELVVVEDAFEFVAFDAVDETEHHGFLVDL